MKKTVLFCFALLGASLSFAQNNWCGTDKLIQKQIQQDPSVQQQMHESLIRTRTIASDRVAPYEIPVVFHIIHDNGIGNIGMDQIEDALRILNEDYNRTNPDASSTRNTATAPFLNEAGDGEITFKLAKRDPNNNCTNGVVRVNAPSLTYNADDACKHSSGGGSSAWPRDSYLNIWVVNSIDSDGEGITLGYAYLPYSPNGNNYGILIRNDAVGSIGTSNSDGRTLTHEMGHTLGLLHTFQGGWGGDGCHTSNCNENGDYCCDTPPAPEATWSCNQSQNGCTDVPLNDTYGFDAYDQIENYMSYDACQNMFSKDQVGIMQGNLDGNISFLTDLVSPSNITASGINEPDQMCKADFILSDYTICAGNELEITDDSYHSPSSWTWTISGTESTDWDYTSGTDANSQNPKITFTSPGTYSITLLASDGVNDDTELKSQVLTVLPNPGTALPYSEGFEDYANINAAPFFVINEDGDATWAITSNAASSGSKSVRISNFGSGADERDELISETIDLSGVDPDTNVTFTFKYAYNKRSASNDEWLKFWISLDCGRSWALRKNLHGSTLSSETSSSAYTPSSASEWTEVEVTNINNFFYSSNFRYKFTFDNDNGNNIYIDDINLYVGDNVANVTEVNSVVGNVALFPNPTSDQLNINLDIENASDYAIELIDLAGRQIQSIFNGDLGQGSYQFNVKKGSLQSGTYLIRISTEKGSIIERVVFK